VLIFDLATKSVSTLS